VNSEQKIVNLFEGLKILKNLPVMELAENKTLVNEIKDIVNSRKLWSIVDDIKNERVREAYGSNTKKSSLSFDSPEFLKSYVDYQSAAHGVITSGKSCKTLYTEPVNKSHVTAYNAIEKSPFTKEDVTQLPETNKFKSVFNSIYSERSLQIGTANDPTIMSSYIDYSPYIYNYQYYISIPTLAQTIDLPISMATRQMPEIVFDGEDGKKIGEEVATYLRRSNFNNRVKKMLLYSALSPRGSLIVPILDGGKVRFNIFNDTQFTYASAHQYSKIDYLNNESGVNQLFCLGNILQNGVTAHFLCPGFDPIFSIGKNRIIQLKDAAEAINIYLYTIKVLCIRAQVLVQNWDGEGQNDTKMAQLKKLADEVSSNLSLSTAVKVPSGASLEILSNNFSPGFAEIAPIIKEFQGMLTGVDATYFYGSDTASYSGNNFNMRITHQNIRSQVQVDQIAPIYRYAVNFLLRHDEKFKKYSGYEDAFDVEFQSLYEPTDAEKAEADSRVIDNLIKMADYPDLEQTFKAEGVLREDHNFDGIQQSEKEKT